MLSVMEEAPTSVLKVPRKPHVMSYDSGEECSLEHLLYVRRLVARELQAIEELEAQPNSYTGCA